MGDFKQYIDRSPFPIYKFTNFRYNQNFVLSTVASTPNFGAEQVFRLNALYDPDETGGGHQPYGFDQWCGDPTTAPYGRYKVYSVDVNVVFSAPQCPAGVSAIKCAAIVLHPASTYALAGKNAETASEAPFSATRILTNSGQQRVQIGARMPMSTVFQVTREQFSDDLDTTTAGYNSIPGSVPTLSIAIADPTGGLSLLGASTCNAEVTLTYYTMLYDRNQVNPS